MDTLVSQSCSYIAAFQQTIREALQEEGWSDEETTLLFSPHGLPEKFVAQGDPYAKECELSLRAITAAFPKAGSLLSYQSKFGRGEWLRPYTDELCKEIQAHVRNCKNVLVIPLSFTSDHIETLFEVERLYLPLLRAQGMQARRCPALNRRDDWVDAIVQILQMRKCVTNEELIR